MKQIDKCDFGRSDEENGSKVPLEELINWMV
jgi:hypothetical protein